MHTPNDEENQKIDRIIQSDIKHWMSLTHDQLIDLLANIRWYQLLDEISWGNEEYIDELLEEIE